MSLEYTDEMFTYSEASAKLWGYKQHDHGIELVQR